MSYSYVETGAIQPRIPGRYKDLFPHYDNDKNH